MRSQRGNEIYFEGEQNAKTDFEDDIDAMKSSDADSEKEGYEEKTLLHNLVLPENFYDLYSEDRKRIVRETLDQRLLEIWGKYFLCCI